MKPIVIDEEVENGDVPAVDGAGTTSLLPHKGSPQKKKKPLVYRSHSTHTTARQDAATVAMQPLLQHIQQLSPKGQQHRSATMAHIPMIQHHKRPRAKPKANHHKPHDANWDISILNKSWQISDDMKRSLPALVQSNLRAARGSSAPTADQRFLVSTKLVVPTMKVPMQPMGVSASAEVLQAQLLMDEVKDDALEKLTDMDRRKYFGASGKADMRQVTSKMASQMYLFTSVEDLLETNLDFDQLEPSDDSVGVFAGPLTARHKYTAMCLIAKLPPSIRLMIRNHTGPEINVSHMAMGDDMCKIFAQCLSDLPMVTSLNVRNNRLTDSGIGALVHVCLNKDDLTMLDLSENKVDGDAAAALAEYVAAPSCALTELRMNMSDVDDGEVLGFAQALHTNTSLRTLELSRNLIGNAEMMNVVKPDMITGGEAIAEMLCNNSFLTKLDLSWNMIRLNSAVELGKALAVNNGLRELNLAYNAFGNDGTQAIGMALHKNNCLQILDLSHNNIPCQAAWVIAQSLQVNDSIDTIILDGNPLGKLGCQGLLHAVATSSNRSLSIPMIGCNFDLFDPNSFNPEEASGQYDLNLSIPYERSILLELVRCASTKVGCKFISMVHVLDKTSKTIHVECRDAPKTAVELSRRRSSTKARMFASKMNQTTLEALFDDLDKDHSGAIDAIELENGMISMGIEPEVGEAARLIARFDIDGTGTIEINEFMELMGSFNVMPKPKRDLIDLATNRPFEVPLTGQMLVEFVDLHIPSEQQEAHTRESVGHLIKNLKDNHSHAQMLAMAKNGMYFKEREAQMIIDSILDGSDVVQAMASILPHMIDASNACQLIECNVTDVSQRLRLQHLLRFSFGPIVGLCTGHYRLEMAEPLDRIAAKKLMEISNKTMLWKKRNDLTDTSQHKNFQCFRNESFNGKPIVLENAFCDKIPKFGVLEFDFVHMASRPLRQPGQADIQPMSTKRFQQFLDKMQAVGLDLNPHCQVPHCYRALSDNVYTQMLKMQKNRQHIHYGAGLAAVAEATLLGEKTTISVRRMIMELNYLLSSRWISVKQTIRFLTMWPRVFQAARLDVVLIFFDRITDVYNFQQVFPLLTDDEIAQLLYRVGWLHVWSPLVPDIYYELDLAIYEQREVAKMLVQLALSEPGENWQNETYGWNRGDPIPGWQLNQSWLGEGNFPEKGSRVAHSRGHVQERLGRATIPTLPERIHPPHDHPDAQLGSRLDA
ncbi:hypothetical protein, variant 1 [Aphanomyces invadans]|uniref:EF-hand domain-containing protein n=1 Tax=Aphanomyces invadans TaxID=157072 RepID=A0A024UEE2_9STRA|nr:hypothetical protein, variant 1 [Aphanomyces invadans]ETW04644.1 hypothetical protein, variant 1 [Aphanomyces invadans]|eukprot:XP_008866081.1 hypothetical protein, variant 1 [Aphanomyces invadans]